MADFDHAGLTHSLKQGLENLQTDAKISLQESQIKKLIDYVALLTKWNAVYNLTAVRDPAEMMTHHLLDSLAVVPALLRYLDTPASTPAQPMRLLDVGSGAGLPGVVIDLQSWNRARQVFAVAADGQVSVPPRSAVVFVQTGPAP